MDITFHYFAVKTLARLAGFEENQAQMIAELSQYVDDYTAYAYQRHDAIPEDLKATPYDVYLQAKNNGGYNFNPSTTGFGSIFDYSMLTIANNQKNYVLPFHFFPRQIQQVNAGDPAEEAHWHHPDEGQDSLITQEMDQARQEYIEASELEREPLLIKIGMLLHVYADTCAHAGFSGYAREENEVELVDVWENISGQKKSILPRFYERILQAQRGWVAKTIAIGHGFAGEAPDCTFVTWQIKRRGDYPAGPKIDNTARFLVKSREILDYLRAVLQKDPIEDSQWGPIQVRMENAFLYDPESRDPKQSVLEALAANWAYCFAGDENTKNIRYHYDAAKVFGGKELSPGLTLVKLPEPLYTQFYSFVRAAQDHLITLYGPEPRSGKSGLPQLDFQCTRGGENSEATSDQTEAEGVVAINGKQDLHELVRFNNGGCVYGIRVLRQNAGLFDGIIWVDAQGPSATGGSGHLSFVDASGDTYRLSIFRSARCTHTLRYNSKQPAIRKIIWSN